MPDQSQVGDIEVRVNGMFDAAARSRGIHLRLAGRRFDDGWLYLVAEPARAGGHATEHARFMTEVERKLRADGFDQVLLVPAVPDYDGLVEVSRPDEAATHPA